MSTKTLDQYIETTPGVCGGKPRIAGHRITVENIVIWHDRMGRSADEIASEYDLDLADVHAALAYYFDHRDDVDCSIEESEQWVAALRQATPSRLTERIQTLQAHGREDYIRGRDGERSGVPVGQRDIL